MDPADTQQETSFTQLQQAIHYQNTQLTRHEQMLMSLKHKHQAIVAQLAQISNQVANLTVALPPPTSNLPTASTASLPSP